MALVKNTNSYVDLTEADAYFEDRLDVAEWDAMTDSDKEKSLVTATTVLDNMSWTGYAVSDSQELAFPRYGDYFDPRVGCDVILEDDVVPARILKATYELAYHLLLNDGLLDNSGGVSKIKVGPIELVDIKTPPSLPSLVRQFIKPLLKNKGAVHWWRAN